MVEDCRMLMWTGFGQRQTASACQGSPSAKELEEARNLQVSFMDLATGGTNGKAENPPRLVNQTRRVGRQRP